MSQRIIKLRKTLKEKGVDAVLFSNFYSIFYLSGFKTLVDDEREAWLLVTQKNTHLFTDERYSSPTHNIKYITPEKRLIKHIQEIINDEELKTLGFEAEDLKYYEYSGFRQKLTNIQLIPLQGIVMRQRAIKDEEEIEKVKRACEIADQCLNEITKTIEVGQSEKEIAFKLEFWLKKKGYGLAFDPIVAINENSAIPHYNTRSGSDQKINKGSIVLIDFGAKYEDYLSDITRMVFIGRPVGEVVNTYNNLLSAQEKTIDKLKSGEKLKDIDNFCRQEMASLGLPNFSHSTGHGVGLEIHELPKVSMVGEDLALENHILTVEPGIYFSNRWGMRIEDTVVIKKDGAKQLTQFEKKMLII